MRVAVLGAAGTIGQNLVPELVARGHMVRAVGRSEPALRERFGGTAEILSADLTTAEGCRAAAAGMDALVYTVGLPYSGRAFAAYGPMMRALTGAARDARVGRLIVISNVYSYGLPETPRVAETHPRNPVSVKGRHRKDQEDAALAADDPAGLRTLVLRLPDFYGPHALNSLSHRIFEAALTGRTANLLGPLTTPHEFVFAPDVARLVGDVLPQPALFGQAYNFAGPVVVTTLEFAERVFAVAGRKAKIRGAGPGVQRFLGVFMPLIGELAEMAYLQTHPVLLDDEKLRRAHPGLHKTPYGEGISATLHWARRQAGQDVPAAPPNRGGDRFSSAD